MKKQVVNLWVCVLLGSFAAAQTSGEVRQEKLEYRHAQTPLEPSQIAQVTRFEEEMRLVKLEVHAFRVAQRRAERVVTEQLASERSAQAKNRSEAEEMKQVKQDYRVFSSAHNRQHRATATPVP